MSGDFEFEDLFSTNSSDAKSSKISGHDVIEDILGVVEEDIGEDNYEDDEDEDEIEDELSADDSSVDEELDGASMKAESVRLNTSVDINSFEILRLVGKGAYGKVYQVMRRDTNEIFAMKSLRKTHLIKTNCVENIIAEKDILKKICHPFIVRLHYAFQSESKLYLIMDFINGGHLLHHLDKETMFSEIQARFYIAEVILALEHLHNLDIIHRDLKPENVLLDAEGHVVLTDFGFAKENVTDLNSCGSFCGTLEYMAPEVIKKNRYGKPADWWSVGILLYDMLVGHPPFRSPNDGALYQKILKDKLKLPNYLTSECQHLLKGLLQRDVKKRFGIKEIKAHRFFKPIKWDKLIQKEIKPPFLPIITEGALDTSNFDIEFGASTESPSAELLSASQQSRFLGFSYRRTLHIMPDEAHSKRAV